MALTPYDTVRMATAGGAEVLGLDDRIGTLEAGKDADLILVDTKKSHMTPLNNPFSALVFSAQASDVDTVFCQGRLLMQNRRLTTIEETEAMRKTELCWKDILTRA
jgi:5-methylthioadenosine/S-adenosylhomocysteine deaminase